MRFGNVARSSVARDTETQGERDAPPSEMVMTIPSNRSEKLFVRKANAARRMATGAKLLRMWMKATEQYR